MSTIGPELPPHLRASSSTENVAVGPQIPDKTLNRPSEKDDESEDDDYGPALPPHLLASRSAASSDAQPSKRVVGPSMPPTPHDRTAQYDDEDDSDDDVGPRPLRSGTQLPEIDPVEQFMEMEERRRQKVEEAAKPQAPKRDEWMLVPPSSSDLLGNLDPTKLKSRQFSRSTGPVKKIDNTLWTETPAERQQRLADEVLGKKRRAVNADDSVAPEEAAEARKKQKRDERIRAGVEEHTRKVRGSALVDAHAKSSKEDEDDPKANLIWDHSRDMSLGGRLMDDDKRNKMIREAKGLGDRFGAGKSGGYL